MLLVGILFVSAIGSAEHDPLTPAARDRPKALGRQTSKPALPPGKLPCDPKKFLVDMDVVVHPEDHDCAASLKTRESLLTQSKGEKLFLGLEAAGDESFGPRLKDLNTAVSSVPAVLFFGLMQSLSEPETARRGEESPDLEKSVQELSFAMGQFPELANIAGRALTQVETKWTKERAAGSTLVSYFRAIADPKMKPQAKMDLWSLNKSLVLSKPGMVKTFQQELLKQYAQYLQQPGIKSKHSPPDPTLLTKLAESSHNADIQNQVYRDFVIDWRDRQMVGQAMQLLCDANPAKTGREVHLIPGINHTPGLYKHLQAELKASGIKNIKLRVDRSIRSCPSYQTALADQDPEILAFEAFLKTL